MVCALLPPRCLCLPKWLRSRLLAASAIPYGKTGRLAMQDGLFRIVKRPVSHGRMAGGLSPVGLGHGPSGPTAWSCSRQATSRFSAHRPRPPPGAWRVGPRPWVSCCGCTMPNALYGMATDGLRGSETVVSVFAFGFAATSLLTVQPCCRLASAGHAEPYAEAATGVRVKACAFAFVANALSDGDRLRQEASGSQPAGFCLPAAAPSGRCPRAGVGLRLCVAAAVAVARCRLAPCREQGCRQQGACRLCGWSHCRRVLMMAAKIAKTPDSAK